MSWVHNHQPTSTNPRLDTRFHENVQPNVCPLDSDAVNRLPDHVPRQAEELGNTNLGCLQELLEMSLKSA